MADAVDVNALPEPGKLWVQPEFKQEGDEGEDVLFHAVGRALSTWEVWETNFAYLFGMFTGGPGFDHLAASRAFGTIASNTGRRQAIKQASLVYFHMNPEFAKEAQASFDRLLAHFEKAAEFRNNIAHAIVTKVSRDGKPAGYFLFPPQYNTRKNFTVFEMRQEDHWSAFMRTYRYVSADVREFTDKFGQVSSATGTFMHSVLVYHSKKIMSRMQG